MTQKKILISVALLGVLQANAQEAGVISGGNLTGINGNVSYTVGQVIYATNIGTTGFIAQGVQQSFEIQTVLGMDNFNINLQMTVYPNPTVNFLSLEVKNYNFENLQYQLFDLNGRLITDEKIVSETTTFSIEQYPSAIYLLKVINNKKELKIFKIIKK
jgi:hypothetical protein